MNTKSTLEMDEEKKLSMKEDGRTVIATSTRFTSLGLLLPHTFDYYIKCGVAGTFSCGLTHLFVTPLDVAKCSMLANPKKYPNVGSAIRNIITQDGLKALFKGWLPTLLGYSIQGCFKFGLYEFFKDAYSTVLPGSMANDLRGVIWLTSAASAEILADAALCPLEMIKVRIQTSVPGTFPTRLVPAIVQMSADPYSRFPFGSLVPLWSRQVPYTMAKFFFFEKSREYLYSSVFTAPKESYSSTVHLSVAFISGYITGATCAIISHPADVIVSRMSTSKLTAGEVVCKIGITGLSRGIGSRVSMVGTITGMQWWIYESFKTAAGLGVGVYKS